MKEQDFIYNNYHKFNLWNYLYGMYLTDKNSDNLTRKEIIRKTCRIYLQLLRGYENIETM